MVPYQTHPNAPRVRRGRHAPAVVTAVILLIVLLGLPVAAEFLVKEKIESDVTRNVEQSTGMTFDNMQTTVDKQPVLLQVFTGTIEEISITADSGSATFRDSTLDVTDVTARLSNMKLDKPNKTDKVVVEGTITLESIQRQVDAAGLNVELSVKDKQIIASGTIIGGIDYAIPITLKPSTAELVDGSKAAAIELGFTGSSNESNDSYPVPSLPLDGGYKLSLENIPGIITISDISVTNDGVRLTVEGTGLDLT